MVWDCSVLKCQKECKDIVLYLKKDLYLKRIIFLILATFVLLGLSAQDVPSTLSPNELWVNTLQHRLDSITQKVKSQRYTAGYCVYDLTADSMLYRYNALNKMKPASTQKLFVSITALDALSHEYSFQTHAYVDGNIKVDNAGRRYLAGDICIRGSFDPTLQIEAIHRLGEKILTLNVDSIDGGIYVDNQVKLDVKKIKDVPLHVATCLYEYLSIRGMKFSAAKPCYTSAVPLTRGWCLATISTPIQDVLGKMLKKSNNTYAECMLLNLCSMGRESGWSYERCKDRVMAMIGDADGVAKDYNIVDGSGLSHDNRSTPELLTTILRYAYHHEEIFPYIYENLPIAGIDGTLEDRMKSGPAYRNVRAKTGTLNAVSTLSGFVTASNGHELAFAIMVNNVALSTGKALQNNICQELAK